MLIWRKLVHRRRYRLLKFAVQHGWRLCFGYQPCDEPFEGFEPLSHIVFHRRRHLARPRSTDTAPTLGRHGARVADGRPVPTSGQRGMTLALIIAAYLAGVALVAFGTGKFFKWLNRPLDDGDLDLEGRS